MTSFELMLIVVAWIVSIAIICCINAANGPDIEDMKPFPSPKDDPKRRGTDFADLNTGATFYFDKN